MVSVNHKAIDLFNNPLFLFYYHTSTLHYIFTLLLYKFVLTVFLVFAFLTFRTRNRILCMPLGSDYDQKVRRKYLPEKMYILCKKQKKQLSPTLESVLQIGIGFSQNMYNVYNIINNNNFASINNIYNDTMLRKDPLYNAQNYKL